MTGFAHGVTITVRRGVTIDNYGKRTAPTETFEVGGMAVEPRTGGPGTSSRDINATGRAGVIEGYTLRSRDPELDLRHDDEVILPAPYGLPSEVFEIDGEVGRWINPMSGRRHGAEAAVRRAVG